MPSRHLPYRDLVAPFRSSKTLRWVAIYASLVAIYGTLPMWKEYSSYRDFGDIPSQIHAALSLILGWLLVFRTNTAYNRWWEARTLWGGLVNAIRNASTKIIYLGRVPSSSLENVTKLLSTFPSTLRNHLRNEASLDDFPEPNILPQHSPHLPVAIVGQIYQQLGYWKSQQWIDGDELRILDNEIAKLLEICGACERIQRTPIVRSYRIFARQCVALFLATLPWGIARDFGWWTIPLTAITAYFMIGLETVAEHVEEPFGRDEDDLDLDTLCATIEDSVRSIMATRTANS